MRDAGIGQEEVWEKPRTRWDRDWGTSSAKVPSPEPMVQFAVSERSATSRLPRISTFGMVPLPATGNRHNKLQLLGEGQGRGLHKVLDLCPMGYDGSRQNSRPSSGLEY